MKVYLSGPMRGLPDWNRKEFVKARESLTLKGFHVLCPSELSRAMGYHDGTAGGEDRAHLLHVIQSDMACLYAADAIALLPGWERSVGCTVEIAMAQFLSLKVLDARTGERMHAEKTPWRFVDNEAFDNGD
jgi:hypothetical protein